MEIGIPKEIKDHEYRVGSTPSMVRMFIEAGAKVRVQVGAGGAIFSDELFRARLEKVVLRTLAVSGNIVGTPSESERSCVLFAVRSVSELDTVGDKFCAPETEVLSKMFKSLLGSLGFLKMSSTLIL